MTIELRYYIIKFSKDEIFFVEKGVEQKPMLKMSVILWLSNQKALLTLVT